jgi:hypothetical protein
MRRLSFLIARPIHSRVDQPANVVPHYRDPRVSWWQYPCEGGLTIIVEVGRPPLRRGEGHQPLRTFIEPDDLGSVNEEEADRIKELGSQGFKDLVEQGKLIRLC